MADGNLEISGISSKDIQYSSLDKPISDMPIKLGDGQKNLLSQAIGAIGFNQQIGAGFGSHTINPNLGTSQTIPGVPGPKIPESVSTGLGR